MRSSREIKYRIRQEFRNLLLLIRGGCKVPPNLFRSPSALPEANSLAGTHRHSEVVALADEIVEHRFPLFSTIVDTGPEIDWRRDYSSGKTSGLAYFRLIPYLDPARVGDHKWIWELNRHQHLVVLAQAFLFTGDTSYLSEIERQVRTWVRQNPCERGINWASALEVAFRAMSWVWVLHLAGDRFAPGFVRLVETQLTLHAKHLENNLSFYFSPNTHLLGEAVALHTLACVLPGLPAAERWRRDAARVVAEQMDQQVNDDGSHFEQSTYYHVYALDMFLWHARLEPVSEAYRKRLRNMAEFLRALLGSDGVLPLLGDDDGGRWFHPYGDRPGFGRETLASADAFFEGAPGFGAGLATSSVSQRSQFRGQTPERGGQTPEVGHFPDAGLIVINGTDHQVVFDAGPFGRGSGGHSHADTLSLVVRAEGGEVLIDPGTYTYVGDAAARNEFRGTAAHSTIRIDGLDQADAVNAFRWANPPEVRLLRNEATEGGRVFEAECRYRGLCHRRHVTYLDLGVLLIADWISGGAGKEHLVEQFWHPGSPEAEEWIVCETNSERVEGWRSKCYGSRTRHTVLRVSRRGRLPLLQGAAVLLRPGIAVAIRKLSPVLLEFAVQPPQEKQQIPVKYSPPCDN